MLLVRSLSVSFALVASLVLFASPGLAAPVFPTLMTVEQVGTGIIGVSSDRAHCSPSGGVTFACDGQGDTITWSGYDFALSDWSLSLSQNPSINSAFGFTNNAAIAQTYVITIQIPVLLTGPASLIGGSTGGSTTDNGDGLGGLSTAAPAALFEGLIDGATALTIYPDPTVFAYLFGGQTLTIPAQNPGLPGPSIAGPGIFATIGIRNTFTLSAGDSVAMTNFFQVAPIPEPSTGLLVGLGLAALAGRRRARQASTQRGASASVAP